VQIRSRSSARIDAIAAGPRRIGAANLLSSMDRSPQRYLAPDDGDFFGVYVR
jgi:hypothetical protein